MGLIHGQGEKPEEQTKKWIFILLQPLSELGAPVCHPCSLPSINWNIAVYPLSIRIAVCWSRCISALHSILTVALTFTIFIRVTQYIVFLLGLAPTTPVFIINLPSRH